MSPKKRSAKNRDLEGTNLTPKKRTDGPASYIEYRYTLPDTLPNGTKPAKKTELLGTDRKAAIEAAHQLNAHFRPSGEISERIITTTRKPAVALDSMNKLIDEFIEHYLIPKKYAASTLKEKHRCLKTYRKRWGNDSTAELTTSDIVQFLNPLPANTYNKHRPMLIQLFTFAIHQGYTDRNVAAVTMTKEEPKKTRNEHTKEGFDTIYNYAPDWMKRAMNIALLTLQRRSDLVGLRTEQVNMEKKTITILQDKSRNYASPVFIEIEMGDDLYQEVKACYRSGILCPYLIHSRPARTSQKQRASKPHPFAITPENLTKKFAKYRDESGAYDHIPARLRPSWHDIRGLGTYLYEQADFPPEYIIALAGWTGEKMLKKYLEGHVEIKPVRVSAGLSLKQHKE